MMIEVKSRSPEAWGPLAELDEAVFHSVIGTRQENTKSYVKKFLNDKKKLKKYRVQFIQELVSDPFIVEAENDYNVIGAARELFKSKSDTITFKTKPVGKWAGDYSGYDHISYVKVK